MFRQTPKCALFPEQDASFRTPIGGSDQNSLLFDNDIVKVADLERDQGFVFRMNINTSASSFLLSSLENIYNTIKDRPDIELKMHDLHMVGEDGQSLKEEVLWSLNLVREFEDVMLDKCVEQHKKNDPDFMNKVKVAEEIILRNLEHKHGSGNLEHKRKESEVA